MRRNRANRRELFALFSALFPAARALALDTHDLAPKFRAKTMDGESFTNDSAHGKTLLIEFWATWCPYCKSDQPVVDRLGGDFSNDGLVVLAVDVGESKRTVKRYLDSSPRSSKIVLTEDTNLAAVFEAKSFPYYVLIDRRGNVVGTQKGAGGEGALRHLLRKAQIGSGSDESEPGELQSSPRRD